MASTTTTPSANMDTPVHIKISIHGKDENRKFKLSLKDCSANVLPDKLRTLLQIPSNVDAKFERYSDSSASFITLDSGNTSVYKQLYRAAKAKGKLRLRVTFTEKAPSKSEVLQTTPSLPDRLTSRKYVHPYISDLSNTDSPPSARLSTLVDLKTASEATLNELDIPRKVEEQAAGMTMQPQPYFWPITDDAKWSSSVKSNFLKDSLKVCEQEAPSHEQADQDAHRAASQESKQTFQDVKQATHDALRSVQDAIARRSASQVSDPWKAVHGHKAIPCYSSAREHCRAELAGLHQTAAAPPISMNSRPCANFTICCNNCDSAIPDAHWHCSVCDDGDFDLCEDCLNRGYTCDSEDHWLIKRSVEAGKVVNSKTETIAPKTIVKTEREKETPNVIASNIKTEATPAFTDMSRTCNQCVQVFDESQFITCTVCEDYDLCVPCHVSMKHGHHPNHEFAPVSTDVSLNKVAVDILAPGRHARHWAICDNCEKDIYGVRHKCLSCPDWDYCSDCRIGAGKTHPGHTFVPLYEHFVGARHTVESHQGIYCDGELCHGKGTYIVGDRYKCTVCHDTDFCASCEALPLSKHNRTHPLIKFKTPVRNVTVSTFGGKADGTSMVAMGDQPPPTSSKATETNAPAPSANAATQVQTIAEVKPIEVPAQVDPKKLTSLPLLNISGKNVEDSPKEETKTASNPPKPADLAAELNAHFVTDLIPDGSCIAPSTQFTQAWTLHNPGPHNWPAGCSVCFIGGDGMLDVDPTQPSHITQIRKAIKTNTLEREVKVGEEAEFKVAMRAPQRTGKAISYWRLKTLDGTPFGHKLWCDINVMVAKDVTAEASSKHQPKVEEEADSVAKETDLSTSKMIFPKLDKESPVSSIIQADQEASEAVSAPVPAPVDDLLDVESLELDDGEASSEDGFLTDEEYELIASGDEMEEAKNGKM